MPHIRKTPNAELDRLSVDEFKKAALLPVKVILDNVRSFHNVGSIFRTADAFLVNEIILCGITPRPPHRDIQKTALGATDSVNWKYNDDIINEISQLKAQNYKICCVEQTEPKVWLNDFSNTYHKFEPIAFIFGHEVKGVQQSVIDLCDFCIEIPQFGTKHSLNISVSAGVVLWEAIKLLKRPNKVNS